MSAMFDALYPDVSARSTAMSLRCPRRQVLGEHELAADRPARPGLAQFAQLRRGMALFLQISFVKDLRD